METGEKPATREIVPAGPQGLAVRSAALVARGLRDLARDSNWIIKKIFAGRTPSLAISSAGLVCAISRHFQPRAQYGTRDASQRVVLYDIETAYPMFALSVPKETGASSKDLPATFAWSPTGRYLVAAWGAWQPALHCFDVHGKMLLGTFGEFEMVPRCLAWSGTERFFAAACSGGKNASLRLWRTADESSAAAPLSRAPATRIGAPDWLERQTYEAEFGEEGALAGYGRTAFSPDEKLLASVIEIHGDWADDFIAFLDVPALQKREAFQAQGHITDLTWAPDGQQIVYCAAGQAYRLVVSTLSLNPLPFGAELCACHPHLPLCVCYSSWLKNSAKGRLFLVDLGRLEVFDEYAAEGIVDLRWSADGSKAYAVTQDGMAYIYEPPLI
jgi:WD40 repeat protein